MADIEQREPIVFAAGDSLYFRREFPEFPPAAGWYLRYELLAETGQVVQWFNSAPHGNGHLVEIDNWAATADPEQYYIFAGYAINPNGAGGGQERHQIYKGGLKITPNLASGQNIDDQTPFEVKMLFKVRKQLERLAENELQETDVNRTRILRVKRDELVKQEGYWLERVQYLHRKEIVRDGRPDPSAIRPFFQIMP